MVYTDGGGACQRAGDTLQYYTLKDLTFNALSSVAASPCGRTHQYQFTLTYLDGRVEYLNADGNIVCMADRYNTLRFDYFDYNPTPGAVLRAITDGYGQVIRFKATSPAAGSTALAVTLPSGHVVTITASASELIFANPSARIRSSVTRRARLPPSSP